jgi:uncharacterized protein YoxC
MKGELMGDLTVIILGISLVILAWTVAKLNEKVDKQIKKFKKFEDALKKNATGGVKTSTNYKGYPQDIYRQ